MVGTMHLYMECRNKTLKAPSSALRNQNDVPTFLKQTLSIANCLLTIANCLFLNVGMFFTISC